MARKSKKQEQQQYLYLGIFISIVIVAVFIFGATYGKYLKTAVVVDPNAPEGACVWTVTTYNQEMHPVETTQACQVVTSEECNSLNQVPSSPPTPPLPPAQASFFPGHTCVEHGFTPRPIPPILVPQPFVPVDPNLFPYASVSPMPTTNSFFSYF